VVVVEGGIDVVDVRVVDNQGLLRGVVGICDSIDDPPSKREGNKHHDPRSKMFVKVGSSDGIHSETAGSTSRLERLVETGETGELPRIVGEGSHDPVGKSLIHGIAKVVEEVKRATLGVLGVSEIEEDPGRGLGVSAVKAGLPNEGGDPDSDDNGSDEPKGNEPSRATVANDSQVKAEVSDDEGSKDGTETLKERVQRPRAGVEVSRVDSTLVGVKVVGREEHREQRHHAPILESRDNATDFGSDGRLGLELDQGLVRANNVVGREDEERAEASDGDDDDKSKVGTSPDRPEGGVNVFAKGDRSAHDRSQLEDCPKVGESLALVLLKRVCHHDSALSGPKESGADTEDGARCDKETMVSSCLMAPQATDVKHITPSTDKEGEARAENVVDTSGDETSDGEESVQDRVCGVNQADGLTSTCPQVREGREHADGAEGGDPNQDDLEHRGVIADGPKPRLGELVLKARVSQLST